MGISDFFRRVYAESTGNLGANQQRDRDDAADRSGSPARAKRGDYRGAGGRMPIPEDEEESRVSDGDDHDEAEGDGLPIEDEEEAVGDFMPLGPSETAGDASGKRAYDPKERDKKYKGFRDTGSRLAPQESEDG
jgi:hypothetical protein